MFGVCSYRGKEWSLTIKEALTRNPQLELWSIVTMNEYLKTTTTTTKTAKISPVLDQAGALWPCSFDLRYAHRLSEGHFPGGP